MHSHSHQEHQEHVAVPIGRLQAFSDGVIAIIITITVLEFKTPSGSNLSDLISLLPLFVAYAISFQTIGTYWNNHHHLLHATKHVSPAIMWTNLNLLFWLSFIPFTTGWLGADHGAVAPTALYSAVLLLAAFAYFFLQRAVIFHAENRSELEAEIRRSWKGPISLISYALAVGAAFIHPIISDVLILIVAIMWFIPDRRIERHL